jgi:hypothetical protein
MDSSWLKSWIHNPNLEFNMIEYWFFIIPILNSTWLKSWIHNPNLEFNIIESWIHNPNHEFNIIWSSFWSGFFFLISYFCLDGDLLYVWSDLIWIKFLEFIKNKDFFENSTRFIQIKRNHGHQRPQKWLKNDKKKFSKGDVRLLQRWFLRSKRCLRSTKRCLRSTKRVLKDLMNSPILMNFKIKWGSKHAQMMVKSDFKKLL